MEESRFHSGTLTFPTIESFVFIAGNMFIIESWFSLIVSALEVGKKTYELSPRAFYHCRTRDCV